MSGSILTQKLLTLLIATVMACPSWALRDCCCTRNATRQTKTVACCSERFEVATRKVSPCCATRLNKLAAAKVDSAKTEIQPNCRPLSSCRCQRTAVVATLTKPVPAVSADRGVNAASTMPRDWTVQAFFAMSVSTRRGLTDPVSLAGPMGRCVRLCRWLT